MVGRRQRSREVGDLSQLNAPGRANSTKLKNLFLHTMAPPPAHSVDGPDAVIALLQDAIENDNPEFLDARVYSIMAKLRNFNREAHNRVNEQRQRTLESRNKMDQTHLGLQNLLYERRHLEREIQKCLQFQLSERANPFTTKALTFLLSFIGLSTKTSSLMTCRTLRELHLRRRQLSTNTNS